MEKASFTPKKGPSKVNSSRENLLMAQYSMRTMISILGTMKTVRKQAQLPNSIITMGIFLKANLKMTNSCRDATNQRKIIRYMMEHSNRIRCTVKGD